MQRFTHPAPLLEVCAGSYDSVLAAAAGGAQRVELCCALDEGGLTPSAGLIAAARAVAGLQLHVLVRPRGGDFLYTPAEVDIMVADVRTARRLGADGVVVGALTPRGDVDVATLAALREAAGGMSLTFHRAFDLCADPLAALAALVDAGVDRLLSSGCAATAEAGIPLLARLVSVARGRIGIMPGSGVTAQNVERILRATGAREVHASARAPVVSAMRHRSDVAHMGRADRDEYVRMETSEAEVRAIVQRLQSIGD